MLSGVIPLFLGVEVSIFNFIHRKEVAQKAGESGAGEQDPRKAQLRAMFTRLAGDDGEVDAEELQDILTTTLTKNLGGSVFSLDACRSMISMLDVSWNHSWECVLEGNCVQCAAIFCCTQKSLSIYFLQVKTHKKMIPALLSFLIKYIYKFTL